MPAGTASQTPISLVFNESEPSDIYYTTDGSTPTTSSTLYTFSGFREQEGATITFTQTTTLKWFAVDPKGNTSAVSSATYYVDSTAPTTTASFAPPIQNGWYRNPTITLSVSDAAGSAGIDYTKYSLDNGPFQTYTAPFQVTGDGPHTLDFYSADKAGNVETTNSTSFQVDGSKPSTTATLTPSSPGGANGWYLGPVQVSLSATDTPSGVAGSEYTVDGGSWTPYAGPFMITADGSHPVQFRSTDVAGNVEDAHSLTIKVDQNNPTTDASFSPPAVNGWYSAPTITLTAADGDGSGVAHIDWTLDGGPVNTYSAPIEITEDGTHTLTYTSTDNAGRNDVIHTVTFKNDETRPLITIKKPAAGGVYKPGENVKADFTCTDAGGSGLASCVGTVAKGQSVDTSPGQHRFAVSATDTAGNVRTMSVTYWALYKFDGFKAPVDNAKLNIVKAGDLIDLKFGLGGNYGLGVLDAGSPSSSPIACPGGPTHNVPKAPGGSSAGLRIQGPDYVYGWQTSAGWAGTCRRVSLELNDGSAPHTADFMFKS